MPPQSAETLTVWGETVVARGWRGHGGSHEATLPSIQCDRASRVAYEHGAYSNSEALGTAIQSGSRQQGTLAPLSGSQGLSGDAKASGVCPSTAQHLI
jgi:hypothetical protein